MIVQSFVCQISRNQGRIRDKNLVWKLTVTKAEIKKRKILGTIHSNTTENGGRTGINDLGRWRISIYPADRAFVKPGTLYKILLGGDYGESIHEKRIKNDTGTSTYTTDTGYRIKALSIHQISYIDI